MPRARRPPTTQELAAQLEQLAAKVARLERPARARPKPDRAVTGEDLLRHLEQRRAAYPRDRRGVGGAVVYGGSIELGGAEYLWGIERPLSSLLAVDPDGAAHVLAMLGHPQRLRILRALIERPRTAAELQKVIGSRSPGPLYHHLRDLVSLGVVAQQERRYLVPARHVVPLLAALALTIDLAARAA